MIGHSSEPSKTDGDVVAFGFDSALRRFGTCIYRSWDGTHDLQLLRSRHRGAKRLCDFRDQIAELIDKERARFDPPPPFLVAIEGYSYGSMGRWFDLGELGGVLRSYFNDHLIPFIVVSPSELKKFVSNNGQARKQRMIECVNTIYHVNTNDDNLADATGLAHVAYVMLTGESERRCELEVVKKLRDGHGPVHGTSPRASRKIRIRHGIVV